MTDATPDEVAALFDQIATEPKVIKQLERAAREVEQHSRALSGIHNAKLALADLSSSTLRACMERRHAALGGGL